MDVGSRYTIGISDMRISTAPDDVLVTYSLGSCVGVTLYDAEACVGAMIHCMLPLSKNAPERARDEPLMFVDTGLAEMLRSMYEAGAQSHRIIAKIAGGAQLMNDNNTFRIGERNLVVARKVLWRNNIVLKGEDVGEAIARTMYLHMRNGTTVIKTIQGNKTI
ncbi:MAG: chemotaxis protein CheD [Candidatus Hydrogenedens sp.]|nr:chemotaxis protein CheD [Candidatus Hydrogenedens sp.]